MEERLKDLHQRERELREEKERLKARLDGFEKFSFRLRGIKDSARRLAEISPALPPYPPLKRLELKKLEEELAKAEGALKECESMVEKDRRRLAQVEDELAKIQRGIQRERREEEVRRLRERFSGFLVLADSSIIFAMLKREREQRSGEISNLLNFIKVKTGKKVGVTPTVRREVSGVWGPRLEEKFEEMDPPLPLDVGRVRSFFERIASDPAGREKLEWAEEVEGSFFPKETDLRILAEAAALGEIYGEIWLLARDKQFVNFTDEIGEELGIRICPPWRFRELREEIERKGLETPA